MPMAGLPPKWKGAFTAVLDWLGDGYWPTADLTKEAPLTVQGPTRRYTLHRLLAVGDVADIYLGSAEGDPATETAYVVKLLRIREGQTLLENERRNLVPLLSAAGDSTYRRYLPTLVDSFEVRAQPGQWANVFVHEPGLHTLKQVHELRPALDGRHLAWIFNRLLTVLGFCHRQGRLHGAVLPCHVLLDAAGHGLRLVGWGQSVVPGHRIRAVSERYKDWYPPEVHRRQGAGPATDLFLAARCLIYLAGGDPVANRMPEAVPTPLRRFLATCLLESARMRPDDAWAVQDEFDALLRQVYGPPKFHELNLT
jgi:hypothetical protein